LQYGSNATSIYESHSIEKTKNNEGESLQDVSTNSLSGTDLDMDIDDEEIQQNNILYVNGQRYQPGYNQGTPNSNTGSPYSQRGYSMQMSNTYVPFPEYGAQYSSRTHESK